MKKAFLTALEVLAVAVFITTVFAMASATPDLAQAGCCGGRWCGSNPVPGVTSDRPAGSNLPACCAPQVKAPTAPSLGDAGPAGKALPACCQPQNGPVGVSPAPKVPAAGASCCALPRAANLTGSDEEPPWVTSLLAGQGVRIVPAKAVLVGEDPKDRP